MGVLATREPGVLLTAVFEEGSKTLKAEVAALEAKLRELQKKFNLAGFITATKREGKKLTVKVLAAGQAPASAKAAAKPAAKPAAKGWSPAAKSARDVGAEVKEQLGWGKRR